MEKNEYTPDLYTLEDEDGNEKEFELLDVMEYEDEVYYALIPYYENEEDLLEDDGEFVVLKAEMVDGEEMLASIEDDDEYEKIGAMFLQRLNEMFEDEADDDELEVLDAIDND
ncbi:MAG: DUF1292 domain-containing protein [Ruminococcus sp.]|nr:DUF1292 domain-containing protein [Ruminococcus sp.]